MQVVMGSLREGGKITRCELLSGSCQGSNDRSGEKRVARNRYSSTFRSLCSFCLKRYYCPLVRLAGFSLLLVPLLSLKQPERIRYSTALGVHPELFDFEQVEQLKKRSADRQKAVKPGTAQLGGDSE